MKVNNSHSGLNHKYNDVFKTVWKDLGSGIHSLVFARACRLQFQHPFYDYKEGKGSCGLIENHYKRV